MLRHFVTPIHPAKGDIVVPTQQPRTTTPVVTLGLFACSFAVPLSDRTWAAEAATAAETLSEKEAQMMQAVIDRVEEECRQETVYMIGRAKAKRLAELVRQHKPQKIVECGSAIGYSGLWMARELKRFGRGKLVTIEISNSRAQRAKENFRAAGLQDYVEVIVGDAREAAKAVEGPVDFAFIDCGYSNYLPCLNALKPKLSPGAVLVADNVGIGGGGMKDYLAAVRTRYNSRTEWFDLSVPWAKRDAMEITTIRPKSD
jgi:predicted O-methyltransferase YrrM